MHHRESHHVRTGLSLLITIGALMAVACSRETPRDPAEGSQWSSGNESSAAEPAEPAAGSEAVSLAPTTGTEHERCMTMGYGYASEAAQALLNERGLQGGGATWGELLPGLLENVGIELGHLPQAASDNPELSRFGSTHLALWTRPDVDGGPISTWLMHEEEAETLVLCTGHVALTDAIRVEYGRLNSDAAELGALVDRLEPE